MDTTTTRISTGNRKNKSELEKFKLFYEYVAPDKDTNTQNKQQRPVRSRKNA